MVSGGLWNVSVHPRTESGEMTAETNAVEKVVVVTSRKNYGGFHTLSLSNWKGELSRGDEKQNTSLDACIAVIESAEFVDDMGVKVEVKHAKASMGITREKHSLTTLTAVSVVLGNTMRPNFSRGFFCHYAL